MESLPATSSSPTVAPVPPPVPVVWGRLQHGVFAFCLCYWLLYAFPRPATVLFGTLVQAWATVCGWCGFDLAERPWRWPGKWVGELGKIDTGWQEVTTWTADHLWVPFEVIHQRTGSGDTGHDFARFFVIAAVSAFVAIVWAVLGTRTVAPRIWRTLHLLVRWDLAFHMLGYGLIKLYGSQFGELGPMRLTTEVGDLMPMSMVGTFLQANPGYELFGGIGEVLGGLLLFHPRTALLGAVVSFAVMANVCALNWLCGVPVKLFSQHLMLFALFLMAPYRQRLWAVFFGNRPSTPVRLAISDGRGAALAMNLVGVVLVGAHLFATHVSMTGPKPWMVGREKSPLFGVWQVESMQVDGKTLEATDAAMWRFLAIDLGTYAFARTTTGQRTFLEFTLAADGKSAAVKPRSALAWMPSRWELTEGKKTVSVRNPAPLRPADYQKPVEVERRTLQVRGTWNRKPLVLEMVEKVFPLQTPFRLRQELPDGW